MKMLEVLKNKSSKFFARRTICRTVKEGYGYVEERQIRIPSETKLTVEYFDLYSDRVIVLIDGRQQASVTYEYLMDCVLPINTDVSQTVGAVQVLQRTSKILDNETLVKLVCIALVFSVGILLGHLI